MSLQFTELRVWREHDGRYEIESVGEQFVAHTQRGATIENFFRKTVGTLEEAKQLCERHHKTWGAEDDEAPDARLGT